MTTFTRISDSGSAAGAATLITLQDLGFFSLTALRTDAGSLKLINWQTGGPTVSRVSDSGGQAGAVSAIAVTRVRNRDDHGRARWWRKSEAHLLGRRLGGRSNHAPR